MLGHTLKSKIAQIRAMGVSQLQIIADFDMTLTRCILAFALCPPTQL